MHNEHEIPLPDDKAMQYYLCSGYFHDSNISNIEYNRFGRAEYASPNRVEITIISIRDIDNDKHIPEPHKEAWEYIRKHYDKYSFKLIFEDCKYVGEEHLFFAADFLFGVFKDTALLRKIQEESNNEGYRKKYYHYRMVFDDGYMDLVFSRFKVKKQAGKVEIPDSDLVVYYPERYLRKTRNGELLNEDQSLNAQAVLELVKHGDDMERCYGLYYLVKRQDMNMIQLAREFIQMDVLDYDETKQAAVWVIGQQGDENDLPLLFEEYFNIEKRYASHSICRCSTLFPKRHIMDAIELIKSRGS